MNKIILLAAAGCFLISCGKNKGFPSTPQITFKSIYPGVLQPGAGGIDSIAIVCNFKDAEGDIQDTVFYKQESQTIAPDRLVWAYFRMPQFPPQNNLEGNIIVILRAGTDIVPPTNPGVADTTYFKLYLKDRAGHISDTIETSKILLYQ